MIGTTLEIALTTTNNSDKEISFTEGLHIYFRISNIDSIRILGLEDCEYVDLVRDNELHTRQDVMKFNGELGSIFSSE
jgi:glucose-6-phosphate 1-epimerase